MTIGNPPTGPFTSRRTLLGWLGAGSATFALPTCGSAPPGDLAFPVRLSDAEWRRRLTPAQYRILRAGGTERAGSSPLNKEARAGTFTCAGCGNPLYSSKTKYDSGTGWPSFWQALPRAVGTRLDHSLLVPRVEVHCARCGGHLGHVFNDGPKPTGKRHCLNGAALDFRPA